MQASPISACAASSLDMTGFVFVVGKPGLIEFPENDGVVIGAGQATSVSLRQVCVVALDNSILNLLLNTEILLIGSSPKVRKCL